MGGGAGREGERQPGQEATAGRLDRDRGQGAAQIGFEERRCAQPRRRHVGADPAES